MGVVVLAQNSLYLHGILLGKKMSIIDDDWREGWWWWDSMIDRWCKTMTMAMTGADDKSTEGFVVRAVCVLPPTEAATNLLAEHTKMPLVNIPYHLTI